MNRDISPSSSVLHTTTAALRRGRWALMGLAALVAIGGAVVAADPAPSTQPAALTFASSSNSGAIVINGTSTMHDWTVNGNSIKGTASVTGGWVAGSAPTLAGIPASGIDLTIPVSNLKSTESASMDNTMYDALNSKKYPNITYHLKSADLKSAPAGKDPAYHFAAVGDLTISGKTNSTNLNLDVIAQPNGQLKVSTSTTIKMTDYGIKPPTAMLGMIKSGDAVTVKVTWQLTPQSTPQAAPTTNPSAASAQ